MLDSKFKDLCLKGVLKHYNQQQLGGVSKPTLSSQDVILIKCYLGTF